MPADCLFCRIAAGEIPSTKLHEDDLVFAIRDINPQAPTHVLVIPVAHVASAADLTDADGPLLGRLFAVAADIARDGGPRRRLAARHERGSGRRPVGRPPPSPPARRAADDVAARMTRAR